MYSGSCCATFEIIGGDAIAWESLVFAGEQTIVDGDVTSRIVVTLSSSSSF